MQTYLLACWGIEDNTDKKHGHTLLGPFPSKDVKRNKHDIEEHFENNHYAELEQIIIMEVEDEVEVNISSSLPLPIEESDADNLDDDPDLKEEDEER